MIKGRVAEAIIKELFLVNGYRVYDYGMERTLPHAVENVKYQKDEMSLSIRHMPDFLVQNIKTGVLNYIEVKYRVNGEFSFTEIENNPYKSTCFVVVSKENIQFIKYCDLAAGQSLPGGAMFNLENSDLFNLSQEHVAQFREYAKTFFEGVK
jgi:hypothetical protein